MSNERDAALPELPEPTQGLGVHKWAYSRDDMRAYARAAIAQHRAQEAQAEAGYERVTDAWLELSAAANAVMAHQWSNTRPAMDALTRLIDAAHATTHTKDATA